MSAASLLASIGHDCTANGTGVVSLEPRVDALLVEQVLTGQLVDLVGVLELFEANLALFRFNDVGPSDDLQIRQKGVGDRLAVTAAFLVHKIGERLLQDVV